MPAKLPRAWTVWERCGNGWTKWYTHYGALDAVDAQSLTPKFGAYIKNYCVVLPAGQRPGRPKKEVKRG